jgi:Domain of unknown function (DUF4345)
MKLGLQIVLGILSFVPILIGVLGITLGVGRFLPDNVITANFDSHYRYLSAYYLSLGIIAWWIIPSIEKHTTIIRILCSVIFMGGLARLISMYQVGIPDTSAVLFTCLELLFPLLSLWQAKITRAEPDL